MLCLPGSPAHSEFRLKKLEQQLSDAGISVNGLGSRYVHLVDNGAQSPTVGELELTDGFSVDRPDYFLSYRELMFTDNLERLEMGAFVEVQQEIGIDPVTGNPITIPIPVGRPMSTAGARASGTFFNRFRAAGTHEDYLTDHELRLISEWLDIGGQYFNNPFDAPLN